MREEVKAGVKKKKSMFNIVVCLVGFSALSERNDYHGLSFAEA